MRAPLLGSGLLKDEAWTGVAHSLRLSRRELEIARAVFDNQVEGAIATNLGISEHTVHSHLNRMFKKLGVSTRVQLVLRVMQESFTLSNAPTPTPLPDGNTAHCSIEVNRAEL